MSRQPTGTRNIPRCRAKGSRRFRLLFATLFTSSAIAGTGSLDPEFAKFPFEKWLTEGRQSQIHWSLVMPPADLSTHQRLIQRVVLRVDGKEVEKRRSSGDFMGLIQYRDSTGNVWQNHLSVDPAKMQAAMQRQFLDIGFYAFLLPGDYTIAMGVCDPKTLEHSIAVRRIHVAPLKDDPLRDSWNGLPPVDMITGDLEPPDVWFLRDVATRLNLPVATKRPVHLQLLLNATPTGKTEGSAAAMRDNMSVLVPALKILSQMQLKNGTIDAALLDLTRRKIPFEQRNLEALNWDLLRGFFMAATPGIIDIHTLAGRMKMLGFFRDEMNRALAPRGDGAAQVVIVLSGPAFFEDQEPVESDTEPSDLSRRLIYIRYRTLSTLRRYPPGARGPARMGRFPAASLSPAQSEALIPPMKEDDLQKVAAALNARLFDAASAHQFRRILAAIVEQLSGM